MIDIKISKILVGIDGSRESIEAAGYAIDIARKEDAELIALTALKLPSFFGWSAIEPPNEWQNKDRMEIQSWHNQIISTAEKNNIKLKTEIIESPMSIEGSIVSYAEKEHVNLIVIGTRGRTGFAKQLLGSVALGVVPYSHCNVLIIK
ncbi:MAG: universal stress protein [Nitrososphaeraceae archaeon]